MRFPVWDTKLLRNFYPRSLVPDFWSVGTAAWPRIRWVSRALLRLIKLAKGKLSFLMIGQGERLNRFKFMYIHIWDIHFRTEGNKTYHIFENKLTRVSTHTATGKLGDMSIRLGRYKLIRFNAPKVTFCKRFKKWLLKFEKISPNDKNLNVFPYI